MRTIQILFFLFFANILFGQDYYEELIEIKYETNQLVSIKVYDNIPYIDQMLGGVAVNTDNNLYTFTGQGGDTKLYTADITTGEIQYEVDVPQIQMLQFRPGSENLVGISKGNPSGEVALGWVNYTTGAAGTYAPIPELQDATIDTHNSAIDTDNNIFYFVGSIIGTNDWSIISVNAATGALINSFLITPLGEYLQAIAFDKNRNKLIGILSFQTGSKSLVEIDPDNETITELKVIPELANGFGGHRYWAYDDDGDQFFFIGLDISNESFLYVIDSNTGDVLFKNPYPDEVWIMEEHSPLELRYSPTTQQLLGLRKGEPLPTVNINYLTNKNDFLKISPNPSNDNHLTIQLENEEIIETLSIFDFNGKSLLEKSINSSSTLLATNNLPHGIYLIVCISEKSIYQQKFIKN